MKIALQVEWKTIALWVVVAALHGCGGGGSHSSAAPASGGGGNSAPVQGVATPSSVSVVTAQNANAQG